MYENAHIQTVAKVFEKARTRTFVRLNVLDYKRSIQRRRQLVIIQSFLGEVACEVKSTEELLVFAWTEVGAENSEQAIIVVVNSSTKVVRIRSLIKTKTHICFYLA